MTTIAIVVPCYGAKEALPELHWRMSSALEGLDWRLFLVDDRSPDDGWSVIEKICAEDERVVGIRLSRNFGQHAAITAGMYEADADWYVVMDCDLQDRPEDIPRLFKEVQEQNADIAIAQHANSNVSHRRTAGSIVFSRIFAWLSDLEVNEQIGNFRIFSDKAARAYRQYHEQLRFFPGLMAQIGFQGIKVDLPRDERPMGKSSYTFAKLFRLAFETMLSYSEKPFQLVAFIGASISLTSTLGSIIYFSMGLFGWFNVPGFASIVVLVLFFGGLLTFLVSFLGLYASLILKEVKHRPIYLVDSTINAQLPKAKHA